MNQSASVEPVNALSWRHATQNTAFRLRLVWGHLVLISLILILPHFFDFIENREGYVLYDPFLNLLSPRDLSLPVFICIWGTTGLLLYRSVSNPTIYINAIYSFSLLIILRIITISLIPLDPPIGLIPLVDPLSNLAYGRAEYITKDLFFSGHTSSQFMIFMCLTKKNDRRIAFLSTILVGLMVLIQHVHYTIDVVAAPLFTFVCVWLAKEVNQKIIFNTSKASLLSKGRIRA